MPRTLVTSLALLALVALAPGAPAVGARSGVEVVVLPQAGAVGHDHLDAGVERTAEAERVPQLLRLLGLDGLLLAGVGQEGQSPLGETGVEGVAAGVGRVDPHRVREPLDAYRALVAAAL